MTILQSRVAHLARMRLGESRQLGCDPARIRAAQRQMVAAPGPRVAAVEGERLGAEVLESGEERAMEPMGSIDRKTVHDAVNDVDGVETTSEGEDPRRYVVISPT